MVLVRDTCTILPSIISISERGDMRICRKTRQGKISRVDNLKSEEARVVIIARITPPGLVLQLLKFNIVQIFQSIWELWRAQAVPQNSTRGDNWKWRKWELSFLHLTRLLNLTYIPTSYYQNILKGIKVMEHTRMCLRTDAWLNAVFHEPIPAGDKQRCFSFFLLCVQSMNVYQGYSIFAVWI